MDKMKHNKFHKTTDDKGYEKWTCFDCAFSGTWDECCKHTHKEDFLEHFCTISEIPREVLNFLELGAVPCDCQLDFCQKYKLGKVKKDGTPACS